MDGRSLLPALAGGRSLLLVAAGGALGAAARFAVSGTLPSRGFPWATLLVNLAGALLIGVLIRPDAAPDSLRLLVVVGFLGAFTTLSAFSWETMQLWRAQRIGAALANMALHGVGGPLAALLGWQLRLLFGPAQGMGP